MTDSGPVSERQCGDCQVCCVAFEVQDPTLQKPAGVPCPHLNGHGCSIYEWRPQPCRNFLCVWRLVPTLPEHWRPDLSGIFIYQIPNNMTGYDGNALILSLANGYAHLEDEALLGFVLTAVQNRQPIYLGRHQKKPDAKGIFLNPPLEQAVAANDRDGFVAILKQAIAQKIGAA
jgi:hypothetical protein